VSKKLKSIESSEVTEEQLERAELAVLVDQFVDEGKLLHHQAEEIALISKIKDARERFLELVKERHEADRLDVVDNSGHGRMGDVDEYLA